MAIVKQPIRFDVGKFMIFLFIDSTNECIVEVKKITKPNQEITAISTLAQSKS
ncbi:MAG: hypothetical protein WA395_09940 [Nitrososphaeraceae archaeon]